MNTEVPLVPNATIQRALRLLEYQRRASQSYYARNREAIKTKSLHYWERNRDAINERRRLRYRLEHPAPQVPQGPQGPQGQEIPQLQ